MHYLLLLYTPEAEFERLTSTDSAGGAGRSGDVKRSHVGTSERRNVEKARQVPHAKNMPAGQPHRNV